MNRPQQFRAGVLATALLAAAVLGRHLVQRGSVLELGSASPRTFSGRQVAGPEIATGTASEWLRAARLQLEGGTAPTIADDGPPGTRLVTVSLGRADRTALLARGEGADLATALSRAVTSLARRAAPEDISAGRLKIDLAVELAALESSGPEGHLRIDRSLEGLWLPDADLLLLPEELLARRLVDSGGQLRPRRLRDYLAEGGRETTALPHGLEAAGTRYQPATFFSVAEGPGGLALRLYRGNDRSPALDPDALLAAATAGGDYLASHLAEDGRFDYSYRPKRDQVEDDYNLLRHAGTCYALAELHRATGDERYLAAARRGIEALLTHAAPPRPDDPGADFEAIVSPGEEAKLGGAALAILAILEHRAASGDHVFIPRAQRLARFLVHQQGPDGRFSSKYFYGPPDPEPFESIYYPGEAILAAARLHRHDGDPLWLRTAVRGADWLIDVRDAGKTVAELPHDHWLLMGLDELHQLTGDERYAAHSAKIARAIVEAQRTRSPDVDWIGSFYDPPRSTPTATRAEGLVAYYRLATRAGVDNRPILQALLRMAAFQRRCQLTPESALYLPRPDRALGGFRRSLTNWEIRIDYVQHNVSALLGLRSILLAESSARRS